MITKEKSYSILLITKMKTLQISNTPMTFNLKKINCIIKTLKTNTIKFTKSPTNLQTLHMTNNKNINLNNITTIHKSPLSLQTYVWNVH